MKKKGVDEDGNPILFGRLMKDKTRKKKKVTIVEEEKKAPGGGMIKRAPESPSTSPAEQGGPSVQNKRGKPRARQGRRAHPSDSTVHRNSARTG